MVKERTHKTFYSKEKGKSYKNIFWTLEILVLRNLLQDHEKK